MLRDKIKYMIPLCLCLTAIGSLIFSSCKKESPNPGSTVSDTGNVYAVFGSTSDFQSHYIMETNSLTSGSITNVGQGVNATTTFVSSRQGTIVKNGYYYSIDNVGGRLIKYQCMNDNSMQIVTQVPFTAFKYLRWNFWVDDNTLLLGGESGTYVQPEFAKVDVQNMSVTIVPIPVPAAPANYYTFSSTCQIQNGKMYYGYSYYNIQYEATDSIFFAVMDYPAMTNVTITKDIRSAGMGDNDDVNASFTSETGDVYMITEPGAFMGDNVDNKPTAIYRIKNGQNVPDTSYFFNTSALANGNDQRGLWYLGNGKAITKSMEQSLASTWTEISTGYVWDFYLVDVFAQTMTKLNLPLCKGYESEVIIDNGKAYIAANTQNGTYIYQYNPTTNSLTQGLQVNGVGVVEGLFKVH